LEGRWRPWAAGEPRQRRDIVLGAAPEDVSRVQVVSSTATQPRVRHCRVRASRFVRLLRGPTSLFCLFYLLGGYFKPYCTLRGTNSPTAPGLHSNLSSDSAQTVVLRHRIQAISFAKTATVPQQRRESRPPERHRRNARPAALPPPAADTSSASPATRRKAAPQRKTLAGTMHGLICQQDERAACPSLT
jgi:hypothetical protein